MYLFTCYTCVERWDWFDGLSWLVFLAVHSDTRDWHIRQAPRHHQSHDNSWCTPPFQTQRETCSPTRLVVRRDWFRLAQFRVWPISFESRATRNFQSKEWPSWGSTGDHRYAPLYLDCPCIHWPTRGWEDATMEKCGDEPTVATIVVMAVAAVTSRHPQTGGHVSWQMSWYSTLPPPHHVAL